MLFFHLENKYVFMFIDRSYTYWWNSFMSFCHSKIYRCRCVFFLPDLDTLNVPYQSIFQMEKQWTKKKYSIASIGENKVC